MRIVSTLGISVFGLMFMVASCTSARQTSPGDLDPSPGQPGGSLHDSAGGEARVDAIREAFRAGRSGFDAVYSKDPGPARPAAMRFLPVVDQGAVVRFETSGSDAATHVHAVVGFAGKRDVRRANVALPLSASGAVKLEDSSSKIAVAFSLDGMLDVKLAVKRGIGVYAKAYGEQADVVHRVHEEGTEDYVFFAERPARPELSYRVEVSRVAGLRLVSNTLEFLDDSGTPMLRVAPPYVVDSKGERHEARLAVNGCAYDTSPVGP